MSSEIQPNQGPATLSHVMTRSNKLDIISTIVLPILLIVCVGLIAHYALNPIELIQITEDFSMSLPLIVCSSLGVAIAIILSIQLVRRKSVKNSFEKCLQGRIVAAPRMQNTIRTVLHPGGRKEGETIESYKAKRPRTIANVETYFTPVSFKTRDGVELGGYWKSKDKNAPTAILFHGNNMNAESMLYPYGMVYDALGFNILLVEFRGYGISGGKAAGPNQELEAYLDAEAAYKRLLESGINREKIVAHGVSLGGAYATALGAFFDVPNVVLDHTFTSPAAVASNVSFLSENMAKRGILAAFTQGSMAADKTIPGARSLVTDGFDNFAKVQGMKGEIFVIRGEKDEMMHPKLGERLVQAKYPNDIAKQQKRLVTMPGKHNDFGQFFNKAEQRNKFYNFLKERNLITQEAIDTANLTITDDTFLVS